MMTMTTTMTMTIAMTIMTMIMMRTMLMMIGLVFHSLNWRNVTLTASLSPPPASGQCNNYFVPELGRGPKWTYERTSYETRELTVLVAYS